MFKIDFIKKMDYKFGKDIFDKDKFDYSLLPPKFSSKDKITLICKKHGEFEQRTDMWLFKGCSLCNIDGLKLTTEQWVKKAQEKHNNHYSYDRSIYTYSDNNIIITCPIHGDFEQIARNHLMGAGCSNCSGNKKFNTSSYIEKVREKHKDIYDIPKYIYNKTIVCDGNKEKIIITCPIHGDFEQRADAHLFGQGCPNCYKNGSKSNQEIELFEFIKSIIIGNQMGNQMSKQITTKEIILRSIKVHGDKYVYDKTIYNGMKTPMIITCPIHGDFEQLPQNHINHKCDCPQCVKERPSSRLSNREEFIKKAIKKHGDKYVYDSVDYINTCTKVIIECKIHGKFNQKPNNHLNGQGCIKCGYITSSEKNSLGDDMFKEKAKIIHDNKYIYDASVYNGSEKPIRITCPIHGDFIQTPANHLQGKGCSKCYWITQVSNQEQELSEFIFDLETVAETSNRTILSNNKELDIYIPSKQIAIEYNGLYWHSELHKDKKYHLQKTEECLSKGVRLIHIFEDEWINKKGIVKSRLANLLGLTKYHTYARKTILKPISFSESKRFLDIHHIQGSCNSTIQLGLFSNPKNDGKEKLLAVMTFGPLRKNVGSSAEDGHYELLRFCNFQNLNIVGGASKLLKYFTKNYATKEIISYCDRRWSDGNLYEKLGFTFSHNSPINYFYIFGQERKNRFGFRKDILVSKYGCSLSMTEKEFCFQQGWYRIYDCGTKVYKLTL